MYFAITGQHREITEHAMRYLHPTNITRYKNDIVTFDTDYPERLASSGFIIKRGELCTTKELSDRTSAFSLLGSVSKDVGMMLKKNLPHIKRFKLVEFTHTDLEVKKEGAEIVNIDGKQRGIVQGYQHIELYEEIDFGKPVGGMTVGMMPSKLAHQLINIGIGEFEKLKSGKAEKPNHQISNSLTIWDPFCGFGTTNMLVNHLGYNTIASDINVTSVKQNMKRRGTKSLSDQSTKVLITKQDVIEPFASPFRHADIIVSEGRLGHIITNATRPKEAENSSIAVEKLYKSFLSNLTELVNKNSKPVTLVITIPVWIKHNHNFSVSISIADYARELGRDINLLMEPYSRKGQLVGRQVMVGKFVRSEGS